MESKYDLVDAVPPAEDFCRLRIISGLTPRSPEAAKHALPRTFHGVYIEYSGLIVGMGRIVGDGALNFEIVEVAVDPEHQGKGLGRKIMEALMSWLGQHAPAGAYITLIADVPELYEKFGFKSVRPESEGMALNWGQH
ncbi:MULTISPECIES: GNAT family N-acetyltransferase [Enterobacterales]|uniref:GCN5 family acetyltransferase n=2 Tax=Enterobacter cloacae complex TaxID=354276 RepID=A0A837FHM9_9ENTR|nr:MULTISPECIES: GNAT family N-acetyltransferase [Enterobacterales]EFN5835387.1 GNAT family N-acetyltransferase [Escherichia coli]HBL5509556.1 GNAT family N-acetyltransferase [Enterobacter hormaechei]HDT0316517.1 GNAT family N-acetyltransferase [Citrobacter amalonaticus]HDW0120374.1 GNAT family N-acetyltransferase [Enterobacter asburiae]HED1245114.1 GNAT family N-acetyltransferase [Enterobacter bugandensis]